MLRNFSQYAKLLMPKTDFPIKPDLSNELTLYNTSDLYNKQLEMERPLFVLHDGPPFANGDLHIGKKN